MQQFNLLDNISGEAERNELYTRNGMTLFPSRLNYPRLRLGAASIYGYYRALKIVPGASQS